METPVVVIRHGETPWNVAGRLQGHTDTPLNNVGRWQAARTAARLAEDLQWRVVASNLRFAVSSDLERAAHTADAIVGTLTRHGVCTAGPLELRRDVRLRETHLGSWQGWTWDMVMNRDGIAAKAWERGVDATPPGGGESFRQRFARVSAVACDAVKAARGGSALLVTHGGCLADLARLSKGIAPPNSTRMRRPNAAINIIVHSTDECADDDGRFCPAAVCRALAALGPEADSAGGPPEPAAAAAGPASGTASSCGATTAPAAASSAAPSCGRYGSMSREELESLAVLCPPHVVALGGSWRVGTWGVKDHLEGPPSAEAVTEEATEGLAKESGAGEASPKGHDDMPDDDDTAPGGYTMDPAASDEPGAATGPRDAVF